MEEITVNIEDFMDVVTTYRCKFCSFTSTHPQGISDHVRRVHISTVHTLETEGDSAQTRDNGTTMALVTVDNLPSIIPGSIVSLPTVVTPVVSDFESVELIPTTTAAAVPESFTAVKNITINSDAEMQNYTPQQPETQLMNTPAVSSDEIADIRTGERTNELETGSKADVTQVTKELFLCGQCGIGYSSIEECKAHMIADHNISVDQEVSGDRVNVGTQVEKKRPGRKKKTEVIVREESDEDWTLDVEKGNRSDGRARRRTRPPKALKEDYYLGRRKRKERIKPEFMQKYTLKCTVQGCMAKFREKDTLEKHLQCHIPDSYDFKCLDCSKTFFRWKAARYHMWKVHDTDMDLLSCDECYNYKTDTLHKLRLHKQIHREDKPYTCDVCGKGFRQISQMRNHQMIHSEHRNTDPSKWYTSKQCEVCKRLFANQKCMKVHMMAVHGKLKPYLCPHCGYAAARKAMLHLHIRTHTGEKPYKCDVCPYTTGDHNSLRRHKMRHTGQKPYKCQHCMYSCIQSISLKTHMKNKHSAQDGVYCCDTCSFRTVNETNFKNHVYDHKNGLITELGTRLSAETQSGNDVNENAVSTVQEVQMQVTATGSREAQISADDLAKLSSCEGLASSDISVAQLIYSALSAISQNGEDTENQNHVIDGVETSISSASSGDGTTTHTITFHLPMNDADGGTQTRQSETILVTSKTIDSNLVAIESEPLHETDVVKDINGPTNVNDLMETVAMEPVMLVKDSEVQVSEK